MRTLFVSLILAAALAAPAMAAEDRKATLVKQAQVGQTLILNLPANRAAGYRWRLVEGESRGLERVDVLAIGWILSGHGNQRLFGETDMMRFGVRPKAPGEASLVFRTRRAGLHGRHIYKTKLVRVLIEDASARN